MSTLRKPNDGAAYAQSVDKLRIYRDIEGEPGIQGEGEDEPWIVDGFDTVADRVSEWVETFATFQGAVDALARIARECGMVRE